MIQYVLRRLLFGLLVLCVLTAITFTITYLVPIDPVVAMAGPHASPEVRENLRQKWWLDRPLPEQYLHYVDRLLHGDLGYSYYTRTPVISQIAPHVIPTLQLAVAALLVELLVGLPAGVVAALKRHSLADRAITTIALVGLSIPPFWLGIVLLYYFAYRIPILPLGGYGGLQHMILPAITIGISGWAWYGRTLRSSMLEILGADHVRTARAKGLNEAMVISRHVVRNALTPVVTLIGLDFGYFMSGILVIEVVFGWPGMGNRAWQAILTNDMPVVMGTTLLAAVFVLLANLVVDIAYGYLDPRVSRN
jgi:peptide/nickel transport system permease protein